MPRVRITIKPNGEVVANVEGDKGQKCMDKTEFLSKLFGAPSGVELKNEYYEEDSVYLSDGLPEGHCG